MRFQNWFHYASDSYDADAGYVQISVRDAEGTFGAWQTVGTAVSDLSGGWSIKDVDLTAYAGETVRIGIVHATNDYTNAVAAGWYVDDVQILTF